MFDSEAIQFQYNPRGPVWTGRLYSWGDLVLFIFRQLLGRWCQKSWHLSLVQLYCIIPHTALLNSRLWPIRKCRVIFYNVGSDSHRFILMCLFLNVIISIVTTNLQGHLKDVPYKWIKNVLLFNKLYILLYNYISSLICWCFLQGDD